MPRNSKALFKLKNIVLQNQFIKLHMNWGEVNKTDGVLHISVYNVQSEGLSTIEGDGESEKLFQEHLTLYANTVEGHQFEAFGLHVDLIRYQEGFIELTCSEYAKRRVIWDGKQTAPRRPVIYYIEIEGLAIDHSEFTVEVDMMSPTKRLKERDSRHRRTGINGMKRNYTNAQLIYNHGIDSPCNTFPLVFYKKQNSENNILEIDIDQQGYPNVMYYDVYLGFRRHLETFLSLLNGSPVIIRKEYIGGFRNIDHEDSETVIIYSERSIKYNRHSNYVNLRDWRKTGNILNHSFIKCFDKFCELNDELDFRSAVYYLNEAYQSKVLNHKFFLLLLALERLAFMNRDGTQRCQVVSNDDFKPLRTAIRESIKSSALGPNQRKKLCDRVDNINTLTGTEDKFIKLLQRADIHIDDKLTSIITTERNKGIHQGIIDDGLDGIYNYMLLDHTLRDVILNLINYKFDRNRSELIHLGNTIVEKRQKGI